ncbi:MAG TPA: zinc ribbon domain-containing protein [Pyrinomonadaceae bacterium]|nr:zinc ribbon domain-containing protein [Pyrinomonadaceae bacterium]
MQPEISHRCPSCGASVRDRDALFCPECGKALSQKAAASASADEAVESKGAPANAGIQEAPSERGSSTPTAEAPNVANAASEAPRKEPNPVAEIETAPEVVQPHRIADKTRQTLHRASAAASAAARGVIEEPVKRVERIRTVSTTVIEEASYDPSLRFVLVALGLFVVFLILLVLSKVMG